MKYFLFTRLSKIEIDSWPSGAERSYVSNAKSPNPAQLLNRSSTFASPPAKRTRLRSPPFNCQTTPPLQVRGMTTSYTSHTSSLVGLSSISSMSASNTLPTRNPPAGTLPPGTLVTVGKHQVTIDRWISEGGFAHVYIVRLKEKMKLGDGGVGDIACLKRVVAPDKEALGIVRTEVDTMKRLKGHRHVVTYIDSHACELAKGGYEVFLLMEYCSGGGLIDFMNTRLQDRLTESEILKIFGDVAQGVACMHYLQPPLLHRDIKVENVLIASSRCYKLCDFGSSAPPRPAGTSAAECRAIEEDIQKHTTLQYRSPEMVDVYRRKPIDEKSDIWALGVFLYKLCYYTTPFEDKGTLAILNATFTFPSLPSYSTKIKNLIAWTLRENPNDRPNIYEVVKAVCILRGSEVPIRNIYSGPTATQPLPSQPLPSVASTSPLPVVNSVASPPPTSAYQPPKPALPVEPMRRGRPVKPTPSPQPVQPAPIVSTSDPFVKLGPSASAVQFEFTTSSDDDDIASRYPTIEELSGGEFTSVVRSKSQPPLKASPPSEEVTALADDAFALPVQPYHRKKEVDALADIAFKTEQKPSPAAQIRAALEREPSQVEYVNLTSRSPAQVSSGDEEDERVLKPSEVIARGGIYANPPPHSTSAPPKMISSITPAERSLETRNFELRRKAEESRRIIDESRKILDEQWPDTEVPVPERPKMVSVGVNTSPPPSPPMKPIDIQRARTPSQFHHSVPSPAPVERLSPGIQRFTLEETELRAYHTKSPLPSPAKVSPKKEYMQPETMRPSSRSGHPEQVRSPLGKGLPKARPQSLYVNDIDFLRSHDDSPTLLQKSQTGGSTPSQPTSLPSTSSDLQHLDSEHDLEYLRMKDEELKAQELKALSRQVSNEPKRQSSKTSQRALSSHRRSSSSGPSSQNHSRQTSLGTLSKGIRHGKFSDAFRKFEGFSHHDPKLSESRFRAEKTLAKRSPEEEALGDEEGQGEDWKVETHDLPVQMKQHLHETRRISAERDSRPIITSSGEVSAPRSTASGARARAIQQRMNEYLSAQNKEKPPPLTADGYGPYISSARAVRNPVEEKEEHVKPPGVLPKPLALRRPSLKGSVE